MPCLGSSAQFIYNRNKSHQEQTAYDPGESSPAASPMMSRRAVARFIDRVCGVPSCGRGCTHTDEELYRAVDNVYAVLGDDAPYTEEEVIAALDRFDLNEEKAISHLLASQHTNGTPYLMCLLLHLAEAIWQGKAMKMYSLLTRK